MSNLFYKEKAKIALRNYSPNIFIVAAIATLLPMGISGIFNNGILGGSLNVNIDVNTGESSIIFFEQVADALRSSGMMPIIGLQILYVVVITLMLNVVSTLISYGYTFYCLKASRGEQVGFYDLLAGFERPGRIIWATVLIGIKTMLWSFLFIIPGILAALSYSQTYRVLIDDPNISASDAIAVSRDMMRGNRMDYFFLELSFFGWFLLEALTGGLSRIYSGPYMECSVCAFYDEISNAYIDYASAQEKSFDDYFEE
ncbi:MAG: DUF975 family protein [Clostridia bacterium]|nr:DUF975 family protein [Clostridia bacterium]